MTLQAADPFPADALEPNRGGRLTDAQRSRLRESERSWRRNELVGAAGFAVVGALLLTSAGPTSAAVTRLVVGIGAFVVAAFFLYQSLPGRGSLAQDLRGERVEPVEGPFGKRTQSTSGRSTSTTYYFDVGNRSFSVSAAAYRAAPEAGHVRLYVLPRSHKVVNLERLPDPPLPEGALDAPTAALTSTLVGLRSHDRVDRLEAMATLEAMKDAMHARATPPPPEARDPRPLAQAIVGTWRAGPAEATFAADGSASVTLPGGRSQQGRWSVDPDGRLHVAGLGFDEATDAWVVGDTLTVAMQGEGLSFRRAAGA